MSRRRVWHVRFRPWRGLSRCSVALCLDEVGHARFRLWRGLAQLSVPEQLQESPLILIAFVISQLFFPTVAQETERVDISVLRFVPLALQQ